MKYEIVNATSVKYGNTITIFSNRTDFDNFIDYLENGLKVVDRKANTTYFNDGARLIDVSIGKRKRYVLIKKNRHYDSEKIIKRYVNVI